MSAKESIEVVVVDGVELNVIASEVEPGEWQLAVRNPRGVNSIWTDWFPTAREALDAGREAIEVEGLAEFMDTEGFEYL